MPTLKHAHQCRECFDPAIVRDTESDHLACLTHALETICPCGHSAARCYILGCGRWQAITILDGDVLMADFEMAAFPEQYRPH